MTISFEFYRGNECPMDLLVLTNSYGLMQYWIQEERSMLRAMVAYENNKMIGWCGYCFTERNQVKIGTFVLPEYRGQGLSRQLLRQALEVLSDSNKECVVHYGGPAFRHFNNVYHQEISRSGLTPNNSYG